MMILLKIALIFSCILQLVVGLPDKGKETWDRYKQFDAELEAMLKNGPPASPSTIEFGTPITEADYIDHDEDEVVATELDKKLIQELEVIFESLFGEKRLDRLPEEEIRNLIETAKHMLERVPKSILKDDDRFQNRGKLIEELYSLNKDTGCTAADLQYRVGVTNLVLDNNLIKSFLDHVNAVQYERCRRNLEAKILAVASSANLADREKALGEIKELYQREPHHQVVMDFTENTVGSRMHMEGPMRALMPKPDPEQIQDQMDNLLGRKCTRITTTLYDLYDDFTILNEISEENVGINQWSLLEPEARRWIESVKLCMPNQDVIGESTSN